MDLRLAVLRALLFAAATASVVGPLACAPESPSGRMQEEQQAGRAAAARSPRPSASLSPKPSPLASARARLTQVEDDLAAANAEAGAQPEGLQNLDESIAASRTRVAELEAQLQASRRLQPEANANQQFQESQQSAAIQQRLAGLRDRMLQQQQVVTARERELEFTGLNAPNPSDIYDMKVRELADERAKLAELQQRYQALVQEQSNLIDQGYAARQQALENQRAGQVDAETALRAEQTHLDSLTRQRQQLVEQSQRDHQQKVQALTQERDRLRRELGKT